MSHTTEEARESRMTLAERAEDLLDSINKSLSYENSRAFVEAEFQAVRADALEEAAKVADTWGLAKDRIAPLIRALGGEAGK